MDSGDHGQVRDRRWVISIFVAAMLAGCGFNDARSLRDFELPAPHRSVVVYGVGVLAEWQASRFAVGIDEYDIAKQNISGNCIRFNRMEASVPSNAGAVGYFAFDVRPGHYVYSGFNAMPLAARAPGSQAFVVGKGKVVYLGDFVFVGGNRTELRSNVDAMKKALDVSGEVMLAEAVPVADPKLFLCMP